MPIYEVELVQSGSILLEADSEAEAREVGIDAITTDDFEMYVTETEAVGPSEDVLCVNGDYRTYQELLEIAEYLDAIEDLEEVDPNQGSFDV